MKNKLFLVTVFVLSGSLLQAAEPTEKENFAPQGPQTTIKGRLADITKQVLNTGNIPKTGGSGPSQVNRFNAFENELILGPR